MISLEQIKQLETRVHSAVARIRSLTAENTTLKESLSDYETRIDELEKLISGFKSEQHEIEAGIVAALAQLDGLEDAVAESSADDLPATTSDQPEPAQESESIEAPESSGDSDAPETDDASVSAESPESLATDGDETEDDAAPAPEESVSPPISIELVESDDEEPELDIF